jgi:serine/threonine-protein kinase
VPSLTKAGRYELLDELGRGAMGVVYRAKDPVIGRDVAVKTIRLVEAGTGLTREELVSRFQTEARAAGLLTHPNIVVVYDAGEEDGQFYITMELVEGSSLQALLDQGQSFPLPRVLRLMEQACAALEFAHQRRVVHRDIKPANLMLTQDDQLKITDFGTAKIMQMGATQTATVIGTPSYMSPEQIKGSPIDGRSDIFALGVILYELVTGEKPFPGENVTTVIYRIMNEEPIPPRQLDASIHPGLAAVIMRALEKDPAERFDNCREMSQALQKYHQAGGGPPTLRLPSQAAYPAIAARGAHRTEPMAASPALVPARMATGPVTWPPRAERKRKRYTLLTLALLALIAVAGWRIWPVLHDFWQTGVVPELVSRFGPIDWLGHPAQAPVSAPAAPTAVAAPPAHAIIHAKPASAETATPNATDSLSTPASDATPASDGPAAASTAAPPSAHADSEPTPTAAANAVEKRLDAYLESADLTEAVQIHAAGDTLTLSGKLTSAEYQGLLRNLRDLPADVRIVDHIEYAADSPEASAPAAVPTRAAAPAPPASASRAAAAVPSLTVTSEPAEANIFVNGQRQFTQTPAKIDLPPGTYRISVSKPGFEPSSSQVEIQAGQPAHVDATLSTLPAGLGWVVARTVPKGAAITVDGAPTDQQTPARLDLAPGEHLLVFALAGYTAEASIVVHPGRGSQVFQVLNRP